MTANVKPLNNANVAVRACSTWPSWSALPGPPSAVEQKYHQSGGRTPGRRGPPAWDFCAVIVLFLNKIQNQVLCP